MNMDKPGLRNILVPMLLRGNLWAALGWLLLERQVCILTRKRGNEEEWRHSREGGNPHSREGENLRHPGPLCSPYSTTFLVPMLLRGNLWAALGWLLLEEQVCILTRKRGNEEEWRHSREGGNPHSREGENLRHPGPLCSPYSTTFLVPMLLRGNLWATLGWLLLERQVRIPTRERGNDEFPRRRESTFSRRREFTASWSTLFTVLNHISGSHAPAREPVGCFGIVAAGEAGMHSHAGAWERGNRRDIT